MRKMKFTAMDAVAVLAFAAFVYGLWLAWHPLGWIVGGLVVSVCAVMLDYSTRSDKRSRN